MKTVCPNCSFGRLQLREYGTYMDTTPINEDGVLLTDHYHEDVSPVRTGYDVYCPRCKTIAPAELIGGRVRLVKTPQ